MVGNSQVNDVLPAARLGMRAIRVAIEEPAPADSAAHAIATSLDVVRTILRTWVDEPFGGSRGARKHRHPELQFSGTVNRQPGCHANGAATNASMVCPSSKHWRAHRLAEWAISKPVSP